MEAKTIFEFKDYKYYLIFVESLRPGKGRGFRAGLAKAAQCQTAYVSQVFNGKANFSLEQASSINEFLVHNKDESRYFLLQVEYARAGTENLRRHFVELMEEALQKQLNLKHRFKVKEVLSTEDQIIYYSDWTYAAIHIAKTIPQLQSVEALSQYFQISKQKVQKVAKFLNSVGLITGYESGLFKIGNLRLHLGDDSGLLAKHHINWRLQAMNSFELAGEKDLHFTSVVSLSEADSLEIKSRLVKEIDHFNAIVRPSKEETVSCLAIDFFSLNKKKYN